MTKAEQTVIDSIVQKYGGVWVIEEYLSRRRPKTKAGRPPQSPTLPLFVYAMIEAKLSPDKAMASDIRSACKQLHDAHEWKARCGPEHLRKLYYEGRDYAESMNNAWLPDTTGTIVTPAIEFRGKVYKQKRSVCVTRVS